MKHNSIFLQILGLMEELILVKVREIYIYIDNVQCDGSESHLEECPSSDVGDHDCSHSEDAGVSCQGMRFGYQYLFFILEKNIIMGKCTCFLHSYFFFYEYYI